MFWQLAHQGMRKRMEPGLTDTEAQDVVSLSFSQLSIYLQAHIGSFLEMSTPQSKSQAEEQRGGVQLFSAS